MAYFNDPRYRPDGHIEVNKKADKPENTKQITKIVITGGPCAGKSTAFSRIHDSFEKLGYRVLDVSESATLSINDNITPWGCENSYEFQKYLIGTQHDREKRCEQYARSVKEDKVLIVCDRGILDNKAYMPSDDFNRLMTELNLNETEIRDSYDAVFHLTTAAKGASDFYTTENNSARTETPEQAAQLDDKLIESYVGHPHHRVIDNSTDFDGKMSRLTSEISHLLGEPEPYEIERKFLIEKPDIKALENNPNCKKVNILQTYLTTANPDEETRVRQRGSDGNYTYYQTTKKTISPVKRVETERRISQSEYASALMSADPEKQPVRKDRYCWMYDNQYLEIDVYPFMKDRAIIEVELNDENEEIHFPDDIKVIREVTDDINYKNSSLAKPDCPVKSGPLFNLRESFEQIVRENGVADDISSDIYTNKKTGMPYVSVRSKSAPDSSLSCRYSEDGRLLVQYNDKQTGSKCWVSNDEDVEKLPGQFRSVAGKAMDIKYPAAAVNRNFEKTAALSGVSDRNKADEYILESG